jgi:hypothetical protein
MAYDRIPPHNNSDDIGVIRAPGGDDIAPECGCGAPLHRHIDSRPSGQLSAQLRMGLFPSPCSRAFLLVGTTLQSPTTVKLDFKPTANL